MTAELMTEAEMKQEIGQLRQQAGINPGQAAKLFGKPYSWWYTRELGKVQIEHDYPRMKRKLLDYIEKHVNVTQADNSIIVRSHVTRETLAAHKPVFPQESIAVQLQPAEIGWSRPYLVHVDQLTGLISLKPANNDALIEKIDRLEDENEQLRKCLNEVSSTVKHWSHLTA